LKNDKPLYLAKTLKYIEALLPGNRFLKIHQSHLVNKSCIRRFIKSEGKYLILKNGKAVPVSRSNGKLIEQYLLKEI
jgi:two-component system LytT family response regulator